MEDLRMKRRFSRSTRATFALALAAVLAVPAIAAPKNVAADGSDTEIRRPVKYYDFESEKGLTFSALSVSNPAKIQNDEARGSKVLTLDEAVPVTEASVETSTMYAIDFDKKVKNNKDENVSYVISATEAAGDVAVSGDVVLVSAITVNVIDHVNSSVTIANPFSGRTDLVNDPVDYTKDWAPVWEGGISVSYWMKTNGTGKEETAESPIVAFTRSKENMMHKDERDKYELAQLYYSLDKESDTFKKLFAAGKVTTYTKADSPQEKDGKKIEYPKGFWLNNKEINLLEDYGIFACMNEDFPSGLLYYLRLNEDGSKYVVTKVQASSINLSKYRDFSSGEIRYGREDGCLTFLASGGYVFTETGLTSEVFKGGSLYDAKESERQFQRNTVRAYTYLTAGADKTWLRFVDADDNEVESLVGSEEWHYITYVVKNDSISLYVDGVVQDTAMFTNTTAQGKVEVNKSFNNGWGYHNSASNAVFPDIKGENGGIGVIYQSESYLLGGAPAKTDDENIIKAVNKKGELVPQIGYNGNCNADTLMEYITDELTELIIGEDGPMEATQLMNSEFGSKSGTAIDNLAFYDVPLTGEEVMAIYQAELSGKPIVDDDPTASGGGTTVTGEPGDVTGKPGEVTGKPGEVTGKPGEVTGDPTTEGLAGDADCNKKVDLNDAKIVLKISLGINVNVSAQGEKNADYDKSGKVDLNDAKYTLKAALGIKFKLPAK